jgi:cell division topological specificity factor
MSILNYLLRKRKKSADVAKERLQIIMARERADRDGPDYLPAMKRDILKVIGKYIDIDLEMIQVTLENDGECEILELNIPLPEITEQKQQAAR